METTSEEQGQGAEAAMDSMPEDITQNPKAEGKTDGNLPEDTDNLEQITLTVPTEEKKEPFAKSAEDSGSDRDVIVESSSGAEPKVNQTTEDGYQSENDSESGTDVSQDRLRKKDDAGYEEDNEDEPVSEFSSSARNTDSEGYEEEDLEESSNDQESEEEDEEAKQEHYKNVKEKQEGSEEEDDEKGKKKSPSFVPRRTDFWDHDDRFNDATIEEKRGGPGKKLWDRTSDRWSHDMYKEEEQGPKESWEIEESRREQNYFDNRSRRTRGGVRFSDFIRRPRNENSESSEGDQEYRRSYRGRGERVGRGAISRGGRGRRDGAGRGGIRSDEKAVDPQGDKRDSFRRPNIRRSLDNRYDDREKQRERQSRGNEYDQEKPIEGQSYNRKTLNERFTSGNILRDSPRGRRDNSKWETKTAWQRESELNESREEKPQNPKQKVKNDTDETHPSRTLDNGGWNYEWDRESDDSKAKHFDRDFEEKKTKALDERPRYERRAGKTEEQRKPEQKKEGKIEQHRSRLDNQVERKHRRDSNNEERNLRLTPSPKQKGRGRGIMSETFARRKKSAEDFKKERRQHSPQFTQHQDPEDDGGKEEIGDEFEDAEERSVEASRPTTKPKRYSSQRQRGTAKDDPVDPGNEQQQQQQPPLDHLAGGLFNPQLLSYLHCQLQQQQQQHQQQQSSQDDGVMGNRGSNTATVHVLQQHILQMQQQMEQLRTQIRRQQLEQEHHQQHQHHQQQQQLFAPGIPQIPPIGQQNAAVHPNAYRTPPGMGSPGVGASTISSPGILYGVMQGIPGMARPPQPQPQQVPEGTLVYPGGNAQQQQLLMSQQMGEMYAPVQGGLFVPPPHMQQQQLSSQQPQTEENIDVNQQRKARSAAIPIKPPPEIAR